MFIVGLTGGIATGKSTVLSIFQANGVGVVDADEVTRKVLRPYTKAWREVVNKFGVDILHPDDRINRKKLGDIIFNDHEKRRILNEITHPRIQWEMIKIAFKYFLSGHMYIVMEIPLLFETRKMLKFIHTIILVSCDDDEQLKRLCKRNDYSESVAKKRIETQMPLKEKINKSNYVIDNSGDLNDTRGQTERIMHTLRQSKYTMYLRLFLYCVMFVIIFVIFVI